MRRLLSLLQLIIRMIQRCANIKLTLNLRTMAYQSLTHFPWNNS